MAVPKLPRRACGSGASGEGFEDFLVALEQRDEVGARRARCFRIRACAERGQTRGLSLNCLFVQMAGCRPGGYATHSGNFERDGPRCRAGEVSAMKYRCLATGLLVVLALLASPLWVALAQTQQPLPYDRRAIFVTHVPHVNSRISTAGGGPTSPQPLNPAVISGPSYIVGPTVSATTTLPAAEEHIAVDPRNASNLLAAISDFSQRGGFNTTKYAFSLSNGASASWTEAFVPVDPSGALVTSDGQLWDANSDPVVAIDNVGNVYLASLYLDALAITNGFYVGVGALDNLGVRFTAFNPVATNPDFFPSFTEDKPWIAVDKSVLGKAGNVYASWSRFIGNSLLGFTSDLIVFSRSTDQGQTWSAPLRISLPAQDGAVQGSQVAVGPNGTVYVVYEVFYVGGKRQQFMAHSINGGLSFSTPVAITALFNELSFKSTYRKNSFASLAVSPANGDVFVVYADQSSSTTGAEVEFIRSIDGINFSLPVVINDHSAGQQFFPAAAVDSNGNLHVSWFDTRNSKSGSSQYDIYATYSKNSGSSFATNARVTAALINAAKASFIGDYAGIAAAADTSGITTTTIAHPVWTNGGFNNGTLQTAALTLP